MNTIKFGPILSAVPDMERDSWKLCEDMIKQAHVLVGGTTGAGKSTLAHSLIYSIAAHAPEEMTFYAIDLKRVELALWEDLPHCREIATTPKAALSVLQAVNYIVDMRLDYMVSKKQRTYGGSDIYLIVDELAELLSVDRGAVVSGLSRIMRLGRAARVHVIGFTQAPNRGKGGGLDPLLCQNFTAAIALRCRSAIESRQIVGVAGAESLPKYGKGIYWSGDGTREVIVPMTTDEQIEERIKSWEE